MAGKTKTERKPVYLIWGADEYEAAKRTRELVDGLCPPDQQAFGLETIDGRVDTIEPAVAAVNKCLSALRTVGFFGAEKVVWLRDVRFFVPKHGGEGEEEADGVEEADAGSIKERVAELTEEIKRGLPAGQTLVINADKINRASALYKAVKAAGEIIEFNPPEKDYQAEQASEEYVQNAFREAGLTARGNVVDEFLARTGRDSRQIRNEIEKLSLYLGDRREVRGEDLRAIVSATREAIVWELTDAVGARDLPGALAVFRHLLGQKESPQGIIAMLESRIRDLLVFRQAIDRRWLRVSRQGARVLTSWSVPPDAGAVLDTLPKDPRKMHWYPAGKLAEQAAKYSFEELLRAHRLITEAHEKMVSTGVPAEILVEHALIAVMRGEQRAAV